MNIDRKERLHYKTIWLSDIHLGYKDCKADFLLDFLKSTDSKTLYLVGDVIDMWAMSRSFYWPRKHYDVIKAIIKKAKKGTRVIYIPGNHDDPARDLIGQAILGIEIKRNHIHQTADGRSFLLCHGDEFDMAVRQSRLTQLLGDCGYDLLLFVNRWANRVRSRFGLPYWSLATYIKNSVKNARQAIELFEEAAANEARSLKLDGIICGHIHQPEIRKIEGVLYCNDGDWIESCTAMTENESGWLEIIHWGDLQQRIRSDQDNATPVSERWLPIQQLPIASKILP